MSGSPSRALRYRAPSAALGGFVTNLFAWTGIDAAFEAWMPAIECQLIVVLGGSCTIRWAGTAATLVDRPALVGPMAGTMHTATRADFTAVGAGLTARGYLRLIGLPAVDLVDRATDLGALIGERAVATLAARLIEEPSHEARAALLDRWIAARIHDGVPPEDRRAAAIDDWLAAPGATTLAGLTDRLGVSPRQAERVARSLMGLSPKGLAMRQRALRTAQRIAQHPGPPGMIDDASYTDQSHMIRDFRRFIGVTPAKLRSVAIQQHVFRDPARAGAALARMPQEDDGAR